MRIPRVFPPLGPVLALASIALAACGGAVDEEIDEPTEDAAAPPSEMDAAARPAPDGRAPSRPQDASPPDLTADTRDAAPLIPTVAFSPLRTTFTDKIDVTLGSNRPGATIHYTLDDKPPTKDSMVYKDPIAITRGTVVRAFAIAPDGMEGPVANRAFIKLEADAANFSSNVGIVLVHTALVLPLNKAQGYRAGSLTLFEPDPKTGRATLDAVPTVSSRMQFKIRGSSTEGLPKKQYRVELWGGRDNADQDQVLLGLPPGSDFVLNNPFTYDRALMRNAIVYALSNQIGRWAPRTRFVEVFVTGQNRGVLRADYQGVYMLIEAIKSEKTRVDIRDIQPTDTQPPNVTGGYIFKVDRLNTGERGLTAGAGPMGIWTRACPPGQRGICPLLQPLAWDEPNELMAAPEQKTYLAGVLNAFAEALAAGNYEDHIEVGSWIDHHAINVFTKNPDAFRLSTYVHKNRGGKLIAGPVWDFDRTLGCTSDSRCIDPTRWDAQVQTDDTTNVFYYGWWRGLFAIERFRNAYFARFKELMGKELDAANVLALIDKLAGELGTEAPLRNFQKWPADNPAGGHAAEVTRTKDWIGKRITWIKKCLDQAEPMKCPPVL